MIRPCPNATIPSGEYVCHFANPHQRHHRQTMSCPLSDEAYDPHVYDGHNIGRFINQGGLLEGLRELVAASDRDRGCTAYSPTVAEAIFAVVEYHVANGGSEMVVLAAPIGQIHLASTYVLRKTFLTPDRQCHPAPICRNPEGIEISETHTHTQTHTHTHTLTHTHTHSQTSI